MPKIEFSLFPHFNSLKEQSLVLCGRLNWKKKRLLF